MPSWLAGCRSGGWRLDQAGYRLACPPWPAQHHTTSSPAACRPRRAQDVLKSIIGTALEVSQLQQFTGRDKPTVIT